MTTEKEIHEIGNMILFTKGVPNDIRLLLVTKNDLLYLNKGNFQKGSRAFGYGAMREDRGELLSFFATMESVIIELIRLYVIGYVHDDKSKLFLKMLDGVGLNRMLRELRNASIIDDTLYKHLDSMFNVRNQLAHRFHQGEVEYLSKPLFSVTTHTNFQNFLQEAQTTWELLVDCYEIQQSKIDFEELKNAIKRRITT